MKTWTVFLLTVISFCSATLCWGQTWDLTPTMNAVLDNGTLTVTTTAASETMPDYWWGNAPWYDYRNNIQSVVIEENVTSIGNYAFLQCQNLMSVVLPNSLEVIGEHAFDYCSTLPSIMLPEAVTTIKEKAFVICESLVTIDIPASVSFIGEMAFDDCHALTAIHVDGANTSYLSDDGVLYNIDRTAIILYPEKKLGDTFEVPNTVNVIESAAFNYSTLTDITIPESVTEIKYGAFWKCENLTSITLPNSLVTMGVEVFKYCTGLTSITIPESVKDIDNGAFSCCTKLASIEVDVANTAFIAESGILYSKDKTELHSCPAGKTGTLILPSTVEKIRDLAFAESPLTSITIPESVTEIGNDAFRYCEGLTSIVIPESVTRIGNNAFHHCSNLTSVTLPDFITEIEFHTFSDCASLTSITIPDKVKEIGGYAFYGCESLTSILFPASLETIWGCAFHSCTSLTAVTLPDAVETIEVLAFANCEKLASLIIPNSVKEIKSEAFWGCIGLKDVTVGWETPLTVPDDIFGEVNTSNVALHVPTGTKTLYEAADVWMNFETVEYDPSGIENIGNQTLKAYASNGILYVSGLTAGQLWSVYSITGALIYQGTADCIEARYALPLHRGIYIVESAGRTVKILTQ